MNLGNIVKRFGIVILAAAAVVSGCSVEEATQRRSGVGFGSYGVYEAEYQRQQEAELIAMGVSKQTVQSGLPGIGYLEPEAAPVPACKPGLFRRCPATQ